MGLAIAFHKAKTKLQGQEGTIILCHGQGSQRNSFTASERSTLVQEQGFGLGSQDHKLLLRNRDTGNLGKEHTLNAAALQTAAQGHGTKGESSWGPQS